MGSVWRFSHIYSRVQKSETTGQDTSILHLLLQPKRLCFHDCLFVGLFICQQDYADCNEPICPKCGGGMGHGSGKNLLNIGADQVQVVDPGFF